MKADPPWANIYVRFRDEDFGMRPRPGLEVETAVGGVHVFGSIGAALNYIRKLHDDRLAKEPE